MISVAVSAYLRCHAKGLLSVAKVVHALQLSVSTGSGTIAILDPAGPVINSPSCMLSAILSLGHAYLHTLHA